MRLYSERSFKSAKTPMGKVWETHAGTAHFVVVALVALSLLSGGLYVFSVNRSAVQGYAIRTLEKDLKQLKKENAELRVREAEAKSLARVEAGSSDLRMEKAEMDTILHAASDAVAFR